MNDPKKPPGGPGLPDPLAMWRDMLAKGETQSNSALNQLMGSDAFAALFGRSNTLMLAMQGTMKTLMPKYLAAMHMPSREDIDVLGERLRALEDQMVRLSDSVAQLSGTGTPRTSDTPRPPKTRQPVARAVAPLQAAAAAPIAPPTEPAPAPSARKPRSGTARKGAR